MTEENLQNNAVSKLKQTGAQAAPSLFTLGNFICGFLSILSAAQGHYGKAGWLILWPAVFDMFDGRVARILGTESNFGVEMDSLADAVSFCTAPAMLMYFMVLQNYPVWGAPVACIYACFGILRLAKFNTTALAGESSKKYFSGLPVPAPAAVLASFAISYSIMQHTSSGHNLPIMTTYLPYIYNFVAIAMIVMAILMVSTVPYAAFKAKRNKGMSIWFVLFAVCLVIMLIRFPQDTVFIFFSAYVIFGLLAVLYRAFKGIKIEK